MDNCSDCELIFACLSRGDLSQSEARFEIIQCLYCKEYMIITKLYYTTQQRTGWKNRSSVTAKKIPRCLMARDCARPNMIAGYACFSCSQKENLRGSFL
jgi:hypothetical protein